MKRKITTSIALMLCITIGIVFTGCGREFDYDMSEYVKVAKYQGLEFDKSKLNVSEADINKAIKEDLEKTQTEVWEEKGTVKDGDTVNINYSGKMNGKEAEGTVADNQQLTIGSNSFIDGFESGLIGKAVGSTVVLDLKFPNPYPNKPDYAGKAVEFTVKINSVKVAKTPELTEDWVKQNTQFNSIKEYKEKVKADLKEQAVQNVGAGLLKSLTNDSTVIKYPDREMENLIDNAINYYKDLAKSNKISYEDLVTQQMNTTVAKFEKEIEDQAKKEIQQEMVAFSIAKEQNIEASEEDVDTYIQKIMDANGLTEESFEQSTGLSVKAYTKKYKGDILVAITVQNVQKYLVENGKAK